MHDELLDAFPALAPRDIGDGSGMKEAVMQIECEGDEIRLLVPDPVSEAELRRIVRAHKARPRLAPVTLNDVDAAIDAVADESVRAALVTIREFQFGRRRQVKVDDDSPAAVGQARKVACDLCCRNSACAVGRNPN